VSPEGGIVKNSQNLNDSDPILNGKIKLFPSAERILDDNEISDEPTPAIMPNNSPYTINKESRTTEEEYLSPNKMNCRGFRRHSPKIFW
jgi:hypothetical protein